MIKKYFSLSIALLLAAINLNLILKPCHLVTGGTQGLSLLLSHVLPINLAFIIFGINIIMLVMSYFFLPKTTTYGTIAASFLYPLFVKITSGVPSISFLNNNLLILSMIAGIICGISGGIIYRLGFSSGGLAVLNLLIQKYFHIKVAYVNFGINAIIILLSCFSFGLVKGCYSILVILLGSILINYFLKNTILDEIK